MIGALRGVTVAGGEDTTDSCFSLTSKYTKVMVKRNSMVHTLQLSTSEDDIQHFVKLNCTLFF